MKCECGHNKNDHIPMVESGKKFLLDCMLCACVTFKRRRK